MIHLVLGKYLKHLGSLFLICSIDGHLIRKFNSWLTKLIQVLNILLTLLSEMPNIFPSDSVSKPLLKRISVIASSSLIANILLGPGFNVYRKEKKMSIFICYEYILASSNIYERYKINEINHVFVCQLAVCTNLIITNRVGSIDLNQ